MIRFRCLQDKGQVNQDSRWERIQFKGQHGSKKHISYLQSLGQILIDISEERVPTKDLRAILEWMALNLVNLTRITICFSFCQSSRLLGICSFVQNKLSTEISCWHCYIANEKEFLFLHINGRRVMPAEELTLPHFLRYEKFFCIRASKQKTSEIASKYTNYPIQLEPKVKSSGNQDIESWCPPGKDWGSTHKEEWPVHCMWKRLRVQAMLPEYCSKHLKNINIEIKPKSMHYLRRISLLLRKVPGLQLTETFTFSGGNEAVPRRDMSLIINLLWHLPKTKRVELNFIVNKETWFTVFSCLFDFVVCKDFELRYCVYSTSRDSVCLILNKMEYLDLSRIHLRKYFVGAKYFCDFEEEGSQNAIAFNRRKLVTRKINKKKLEEGRRFS
eukprot:snap_masked-scaffold_15-processed-gene-6.15-mRNA-1 protein AED:1.00 eAED:1.00 QI:0/-1/0/0/-1/1/1/0/386